MAFGPAGATKRKGTDPRKTVQSYVARAGASHVPVTSREAIERAAAGHVSAGFWDRVLSPFTMIEKNIVSDPLEAILHKNYGKFARELAGGLTGADYAVDVSKALLGKMSKAEATKAPSSVLTDFGWKPNFITGLGIDIALDPITWASLGTAFGAKAGISAAIRGTAGKIADSAVEKLGLVSRVAGLPGAQILEHAVPTNYLSKFERFAPEVRNQIIDPASDILTREGGLDEIHNALREAIHSDITNRVFRRGTQSLTEAELNSLSDTPELAKWLARNGGKSVRDVTARQFRRFVEERRLTTAWLGAKGEYEARPLTALESLIEDPTQRALAVGRRTGEAGWNIAKADAIVRPAELERAGHVLRFRPFTEGLTEFLERNVFGGKTIGVTRYQVEKMLQKAADPVIRGLQWMTGTSVETATKWKKLLDDFPMLGKVISKLPSAEGAPEEIGSLQRKATTATTDFFDRFRKGASIRREIRNKVLEPELEGFTGAERLARRYGFAQGTKQYAKKAYEDWIRSGLNDVAQLQNYVHNLSQWSRQENQVLKGYFPGEGAFVGEEAGVNLNGHQLINDLLESDAERRKVLLNGVEQVNPEAADYLRRYTRVLRDTYDEAYRWRRSAGFGKTYMDQYASHIMTDAARAMRGRIWDENFLERATRSLGTGMERRRGMRETINAINEASNYVAHQLAADDPEIAKFLDSIGGRFDFFESNPLATVSAHASASQAVAVHDQFYKSVEAMSKAMGWNERANHPSLVEVKFPWKLNRTEKEQAKLIQQLTKSYQAQHRLERQIETVQAKLDSLYAKVEYVEPNPDVVRREKALEQELAGLKAKRAELNAALERDVGPGANRQQAAVKARQADVAEEQDWLRRMASEAGAGEVSQEQLKKLKTLSREAKAKADEVDAAERTLRQAERKYERVGPGQAQRARKYANDVRRARRELTKAQEAAVAARDELSGFRERFPKTRYPYPSEEEIIRVGEKAKAQGVESLTPAEQRVVEEVQKGPPAPPRAQAAPVAEVTSTEKLAGEVKRKTAASTGQNIILIDTAKGGDWIDDGESGRWITFNDDTSEFMAHRTKRDAEQWMDQPEVWSSPSGQQLAGDQQLLADYREMMQTVRERVRTQGRDVVTMEDLDPEERALFERAHPVEQAMEAQGEWLQAEDLYKAQAALDTPEMRAALAAREKATAALERHVAKMQQAMTQGVTAEEVSKLSKTQARLEAKFQAAESAVEAAGGKRISQVPEVQRTIEVRVPQRFYEDAISREIIPEDTHVRSTKRDHTIRLTPDEYHELLGDAKFYADPSMGYDQGLRESAKATANRLEAVNVPKVKTAPAAAFEEAAPTADEIRAQANALAQERLVTLADEADKADKRLAKAEAEINRLMAHPKTESARRQLREAQREFDRAEAVAVKAHDKAAALRRQVYLEEDIGTGLGADLPRRQHVAEFPQFSALADELQDPLHPSGYGRPADAPHINAINAQRRKDLETTDWLTKEVNDALIAMRRERKAGMGPYQLQDEAINDLGLADVGGAFSQKRFDQLVAGEAGKVPFQSAIRDLETNVATEHAKHTQLLEQLNELKGKHAQAVQDLQDQLYGARAAPSGVRWGEEAAGIAAETEQAANQAINAFNQAEAELNHLVETSASRLDPVALARGQDVSEPGAADAWRDLLSGRESRRQAGDDLTAMIKAKRQEVRDLRTQMEQAITARDEAVRAAQEAEGPDIYKMMRVGEGDKPVGMGTTPPDGGPPPSGVYAPRELAKMVENMWQVKEDPSAYFRFYRKALGIWKGLATAVFPFSTGFTIRNFMGNVFNAYMAGLRNPGAFKRGFKIQWTIAKSLEGLTELDDAGEILARLAGDLRHSNLSPMDQAIGMMAVQSGVVGHAGVMGANDLPELAGGAARSAGGIIKNLEPGVRETLGQQLYNRMGGGIAGRIGRVGVKSITQPITAGLGLNAFIEDASKLAVMLDTMDKGADMRSAAMHARISMVDYEDLTEAEQKYFRNSGLVPFYSWLRKESALMMNWMMTQPEFFHKTMQIQSNAWRNWSPEGEFIPGYYFEQGFPLPPQLLEHLPQGWQEQMRLFAPDLPMFGIGEAGQGLAAGDLSQLAGNVGPVFQTPMALLAGKNLFSQSPLDERGHEANIALSRLKGLPLGPLSIRGTKEGGATYSAKGEYLWEQLLPVLAKIRTAHPTDESDKEKRARRLLSSTLGLGFLPFGEQTQKNEAYRRLDRIQQLVNQLEAQGYVLEPSSRKKSGFGATPR